MYQHFGRWKWFVGSRRFMFCFGVFVQLLMTVEFVRRMKPRKFGNDQHFDRAWCLQDGPFRFFGLPNFYLWWSIVWRSRTTRAIVRVQWAYCVIQVTCLWHRQGSTNGRHAITGIFRNYIASKLRFLHTKEFLRELSAIWAYTLKIFASHALGRKTKEFRLEGAPNY